MLIPKERGALSALVFESLRVPPVDWSAVLNVEAESVEDEQIALWALYELNYHGFDDAADALEWQPEVLQIRFALEQQFESRLRGRWALGVPSGRFEEAFFEFVDQHEGPSLASFIHREADVEQILEILRMRTIYHLKEADPTAWLIPRLTSHVKAALVELQYDEYGCGDPGRLHASMFGRGLEACGLRSEYGAYIDDVPVEVLEANNAMSLFGLHRRLRGAALGHLAAFEATSSLPSRRIAQGLERTGLASEMIDYYVEHVEADAVHEQLAVRTICGGLATEAPALVPDLFFGAFTCLDLEDRFAHRMLEQFAA